MSTEYNAKFEWDFDQDATVSAGRTTARLTLSDVDSGITKTNAERFGNYVADNFYDQYASLSGASLIAYTDTEFEVPQ